MRWTTKNLKRIYDDGYPAAPFDLREDEALLEEGLVLTFGDVKVKRNGTGKSAFLWRYRDQLDRGAFAEEAQAGPDCVSHGDRNTRDTTRCVEILVKKEPESYVARGATEPTYMARGHRGGGMNPALATKFVTEHGYVIRKNYPGVADFSKYDHRLASRYSTPPDNIIKLCDIHPVGRYLRAQSPAEAKALFYNGYACHSGQNIGFSSSPNRVGIHERSGSWNHDMATVGYDDTKTIWPVCVYFIVNSWGDFNKQWTQWKNDKDVQRTLGPVIRGMIVAEDSVWERYFLPGSYFYADVEGFRSKKLPNFGTSSFLGG